MIEIEQDSGRVCVWEKGVGEKEGGGGWKGGGAGRGGTKNKAGIGFQGKSF